MWAVLLALVVLFQGCSCGSPKGYEVVVDSSWGGVVDGAQVANVNGFIDDLLMEISTQSGIRFNRIRVSGEREVGKRGEVGALSVLAPYSFNQALYDFSDPLLPIGNILVVQKGASMKKLEDLRGEVVGYVKGEEGLVLIQKVEGVLPRSYQTAPEALLALASGGVEAVVLPRLLAEAYVRDLFAFQLKCVEGTIDGGAIRLISKKGDSEGEDLQQQVKRAMKALRKKGKIQALQKKWGV
jgi:hypothetical protein